MAQCFEHLEHIPEMILEIQAGEKAVLDALFAAFKVWKNFFSCTNVR